MSPPDQLSALVKQFGLHVEDYKRGIYNETQLRREYVDPLFEFLGWDVSNRKGYAEAYKDVIHEDAIKVGGSTKAPDYCFRIGGTRKFFVEAKKPKVNIKGDPSAAYQVRRYAWSSKLPLSILTDFEEFAVYDCRVRPNKSDSPAKARILYLTFEEFEERWDEIAGIFSRNSILTGSFDKFADSNKGKRGTAEVDDAFLDEIRNWRKLLAAEIAKENENIDSRELNFAVQRTIDRIVFLRICEDRGIEPYGQLAKIGRGNTVYKSLVSTFHRADEKYNSGLFHFRTERDRPASSVDEITPSLKISDSVVSSILNRLYYPDSPYEFSVLPADILGQVYEQFLGQVIHLTPKRRVRIDDKPEVRKAGGVYYTPSYVVDEIVRRCLDRFLKDKKPGPRGGVSRLRVLDPSCGSGSFLIAAYQYLLDWHLSKYIDSDPASWAQGSSPTVFQNDRGEWRLTTAERKRILLNNIFGVDIDAQAVEVTKLSLLLKMLEGENEQSLERQLRMFEERVLPELDTNIKCGNSLIANDYYLGRSGDLLEEELFRVNAFDWEREFRDIFATGGFDAIIGNPPWGAAFTEEDLSYLRDRHRRVISRMIDSYIYFISRSAELAKDDGVIGMILPSTILNQADARPVRELLLERGISYLASLGQGVFGRKVLNTSTIVVSEKRGVRRNIEVVDVTEVSAPLKYLYMRDAQKLRWTEWADLVWSDPHRTYFTQQVDAVLLLRTLREKHVCVEDVVEGKIQRGVSPDIAAAHVIPAAARPDLDLEEEILWPSVSGSQFNRYGEWSPDQFIIYTNKSTNIDAFPKAKAYMAQFKSKNTCKEVEQGKHPWWRLHRARDPAIFESPKFVGLTTSKKIELLYDDGRSVCATDAMYVFRTVQSLDWRFAMAVFQSRTFLFLYRTGNQNESRVIPQIKATKLYSLPFPDFRAIPETVNHVCSLVDNLYATTNRIHTATTNHEKNVLQRQLERIEEDIEQGVQEAYGLDQTAASRIGAMFPD